MILFPDSNKPPEVKNWDKARETPPSIDTGEAVKAEPFPGVEVVCKSRLGEALLVEWSAGIRKKRIPQRRPKNSALKDTVREHLQRRGRVAEDDLELAVLQPDAEKP